tara:strand:+ start:1227 stop:1592 length:366 start_codon:yes stop_codon:yes gene_type:complete
MNRDTEIVRNTLMWIWNVDWRTFADVVFDVDIDTAPDHRLEYLAKYNEARINNPADLFAMLDYEKMDKITTAASEKYGAVKLFTIDEGSRDEGYCVTMLLEGCEYIGTLRLYKDEEGKVIE